MLTCSPAGSWIEAFYQLGMNVYAMDHQSHGRSEGWRQWRCNVSKFDYLVDDGIQFLSETVCGDPQLPEDVPIVLVGYSMGGNVVIQCLGRIYTCEKLLAIKSRVTQAVLLAPLIKIKLDWKTKLMLMINRSLISCWLPNLRFSRAENSGDCPFLGWWYDKDPFTYSGEVGKFQRCSCGVRAHCAAPAAGSEAEARGSSTDNPPRKGMKIRLFVTTSYE